MGLIALLRRCCCDEPPPDQATACPVQADLCSTTFAVSWSGFNLCGCCSNNCKFPSSGGQSVTRSGTVWSSGSQNVHCTGNQCTFTITDNGSVVVTIRCVQDAPGGPAWWELGIVGSCASEMSVSASYRVPRLVGENCPPTGSWPLYSMSSDGYICGTSTNCNLSDCSSAVPSSVTVS